MAKRVRSEPLTVFGLAHLVLDAYGPSTIGEVHRIIELDAMGERHRRVSHLRVARALHELVASRAAEMILDKDRVGVVRFALRSRAAHAS